MQCRRRGAVFRALVVGVVDRTLAAPGAFPQRPVAPVAADVVLALQAVARHHVGAEQEAIRFATNEISYRVAPGRHLAHLPLGRAGVVVQVGVALQQRFQMVGVLRVAAHVGRDPRHVGELLQHALQADVLVRLGAELGSVGVGGAEPAVGVGDVDHDDPHPGGAGAAGGGDAPGCVHEQAALPAARRRPELDDLHALFQKALQHPGRRVVRLVRLAGDAAVEAEHPAEALAQRRNVLHGTHTVDTRDAELVSHGKHRLGLGEVAGRPFRSVRGLRAHHVGVDVDQRRRVGTEMAALAIVEAGHVVLGGGHGNLPGGQRSEVRGLYSVFGPLTSVANPSCSIGPVRRGQPWPPLSVGRRCGA